MAKLPEITKLNEITPAGCILMAYRGSITHGMFIPSDDPNSIDDIDLMGIYIESMDFYTGLNNRSLGFGGSKTDSDDFFVEQYDVVNYEFRKFLGLLLKGNPNVLSLLYLNPSHIISKHEIWDDILEVKDIFLSKTAFYSFGGYANEQLRKMTSGAHQGYMGEKRKALVEKYGYDTKNAAHLIRLLRMGVEYLNYGVITVDRTNIDAVELLHIKKGEATLEDIRHLANIWNDKLQKAFEESKLPEKPDFEAANNLCSALIHKYHRSLIGAG